MDENKVTPKELKSMFWRSFFVMATINYERFQSLGFTFVLAPILKKFYKTDSERAEALKRHMKMYNSNPFMANPILGTVVALEEKNAAGEDVADSINSIKVGLMGPFAGIGDSLFWGTIRPILAGIAAGLALNGSILGPILFLILWNIFNFGFRYYSLNYGYKMGIGMLKNIRESNLVQKISEGASVVGLMVLGVLVASWIRIETPLQFHAGKQVMKVQEILDGIVPSMLPLIATLLLVYFLKKGTKPNTLLLWIFIISFAAGAFGILK
ncbi:PTS system mannose/fructose/sorbose family transporter subunit IID [Aneurinibacillus terranovensis]|uniref:PTS system mannose/fructose/sorbose family transporter subunit IID n=1 Tax=Aneurinibacillus terranovensis TaxID=278991 RepID=UPI00041F37D0|nr:PTS system mannose/fructose/sorbose family transporter subunit IID [Aneurinibacillus terranovensis]